MYYLKSSLNLYLKLVFYNVEYEYLIWSEQKPPVPPSAPHTQPQTPASSPPPAVWGSHEWGGTPGSGSGRQAVLPLLAPRGGQTVYLSK